MNFTVYKSSAGSGKTFTLVKEYLKIALGSEKPDTYRGILAITFTNKATNEMKERIISALKILSSGNNLEAKDKNLQDVLLKEIKIDNKILTERAKKTLSHLLHHYSDFSISTIDKFVHRVIRSFARDLNLPMNFEVELDEENILQKSIDRLISKVGKDELLTNILVEFTERKTDDEKSWSIEKDLFVFAQEMQKEDSFEFLDNLKNIELPRFFSLKEKLFDEINFHKYELKKIGENALEIIAKSGISEDCFAGGKNGVGRYFTHLAEFHEEKIYPTDTVKKNADENKWKGSKASANEKKIIDSIQGTLEKLYRKAIPHVENYFLLQLVLKNFYSLAVLRELEIILDEFKKEKNIIHISEFNKKISTIISGESAPFIYERLGEKYHHFLIDEFQDTSVLQWQNLLPLIHNSLSEGNFNMVVGDGKQAIYRWRSGDVQQFADLPNLKNSKNDLILAERERALIANFHPEFLDKNFRSKREIVEFNNYFFGKLAEKLDVKFQSIYANHHQEFKAENTGGFVCAEILRKGIIENIHQKNLERTLEIIQDSLKQNFSLRDICILCRNNNNASEIASFLLENKIDVISSEGLLLSQSAEVNFLISFLSFLDNRFEKKFQAEIAIFLIEKKIINEKLHRILSLINEKENDNFLSSFLKNGGYKINFFHLKKLPLYELAEELIRIFSLNENANPYIAFFLEFVQSFANSETSNISEFLQYWESKKNSASIGIPEGANAVRITTIHKSKGLEFPVVIFPFANWSEKLTKNYFWVDMKNSSLAELNSAIVNAHKILEKTPFKKLYEDENNKTKLDNFNLLYVAFTRAKEQLYVITSEEERKNFSKNFIDILKEHKEWNNENYILQIGNYKSETENKTSDIRHPTSDIKKLISSDWRNKVYISKNSEKYSEAKQKNYGKLLHYALSFVHTENDINFALEKMNIAGICNEEEKKIIEEKIKKLLSNSEINKYFQKDLNIKTEAEILLENGDVFRPDRVIISGDSAIIIDFKTGIEKPEHIEQMEKYSDALKKMNFEKVEKILIYTEEEKVIKV